MQQTEKLWEKALRRFVPLSPDSLAEQQLLEGKLELTGSAIPESQVLVRWINACLAEDGGPLAARERAATLGRNYRHLDTAGRARFLLLLIEQYSASEDAISDAIAAWQKATTTKQRATLNMRLRDALEPPRTKLLAQLNSVPEGVKFLVDMRADVISLLKELPALQPLEADLKRLLNAWFDIGLLQLEQITWQHSSAEVLEKLIEYEAVHDITSWDDLKNRLRTQDRRCYALFHPSMPSEPLIFVQVALTSGLAVNIQDILRKDAPPLANHLADTAIFYSISNAQRGLAGISFGNYLIKNAVTLLQQELPHLKQFSTLSPIVGFCQWWKKHAETHAPPEYFPQTLWDQLLKLQDSPQDLLYALQTFEDDNKTILLKLVAQYLAIEKREGKLTAIDPVAHFHLSNGAMIGRINWLGDLSLKGVRQSCGLMVNYVYEVKKIEQRSQEYGQQAHVPVSGPVKRLLKQ